MTDTGWTAAWERGAQFLAGVRKDGDATTFFFPLPAGAPGPAPPIGDIVSVELTFRDRDTSFHVHGRVLELVDGGLRLAFLPDERDRRELVLACAEGESIPYLRRKSVRTPVILDVEVTLPDGRTQPARLTNISERGTHLTVDSLTADDRVTISILFPGARKRVQLVGRVTSPVTGPQRGVGIEFLFRSRDERDALAAEVERIRAAGR